MNTSLKSKSNSRRVSNALHAHLIMALVLGALIYILALTGTASVFNREFQRWEQPYAPEMRVITPEAAAAGARTVFSSEETPSTHLYINFPQPDLPRTVVTTDTQAVFLNEQGEVAGEEHFPWTQFLLDLHYYLHLPQTLGLTVVGALGAFLIAMSISGFMGHPRIFRDAFTLRRGNDLIPVVDLHNRLSVWTSPFHLSNALTGSLLGLASLLAFTIAAVSFEGDTDQVFDPVFGGEPAMIKHPAPLANIAGPLQYMASKFPELPTTFFILHDPGTAGQHVNIVAQHTDRLIFGDYYNFNAQGVYQGNVGISDGTIGQQIIGSVYNIHFGNWGGLPVKLSYGVFGLALCTIIASGLRIYFMRRRQKGQPSPHLEACWEAIVWGVPLLLSAALLLCVLGMLQGLGSEAFFWGGLTLVTGWSAISGDARGVRRSLQLGTAALILVTVVAHGLENRAVFFTAATLPVSTGLAMAATVLIFRFFRSKRTVGYERAVPA